MEELGQARANDVIRCARARQDRCQLLKLVAVPKLPLCLGAGVAVGARLVEQAPRGHHQNDGGDGNQDCAGDGGHCAVRRLESGRAVKKLLSSGEGPPDTRGMPRTGATTRPAHLAFRRLLGQANRIKSPPAEVIRHTSAIGSWEMARRPPHASLAPYVRGYVGWFEHMAAP